MRACGTARRLRTSWTTPRKEPQVLSVPAYAVVLVKQVLSLGTVYRRDTSSQRAAGTQFTGFASRNVETLTPEELRARQLALLFLF